MHKHACFYDLLPWGSSCNRSAVPMPDLFGPSCRSIPRNWTCSSCSRQSMSEARRGSLPKFRVDVGWLGDWSAAMTTTSFYRVRTNDGGEWRTSGGKNQRRVDEEGEAISFEGDGPSPNTPSTSFDSRWIGILDWNHLSEILARKVENAFCAQKRFLKMRGRIIVLFFEKIKILDVFMRVFFIILLIFFFV